MFILMNEFSIAKIMSMIFLHQYIRAQVVSIQYDCMENVQLAKKYLKFLITFNYTVSMQ